MSLTFREQIEETAWELGNGEGTVPELRQRFDDNPDTPNFDPAKALEMLHILQIVNYRQVPQHRGRPARSHFLKQSEYSVLDFDIPKPIPKDERERQTRIQWAKDFRTTLTGCDAELLHDRKRESMKESVTIQYLCEDADTNLVETIPIASISIDQWSQATRPVQPRPESHHGRRMLSVLITACEAVLHEIQDIKWED